MSNRNNSSSRIVFSLSTAWWMLTATLVAVLLRMWHIVLMKEGLERPLVLGAWLAGAWLIVGVTAACERRAGTTASSGVLRLWSQRSLHFWAMLGVFSILLLLFHVGFLRAASDGRGYFAQVHSLVIDRDLDFANDIDAFGARRSDATYPLGTALMWVPFFVLAHLWLGLLNFFGAEYVRDGYWNPYQRAVGLGTFLYGFGALAMICAALRRFFDGPSTLVAALTILLATPVVWYITVDGSMSHGASLFAVTAFLVTWLTSRGRRRGRDWFLLGGLAALMIAVRPQNMLFAAGLAIEAVDVLWKEWRHERDPVRLLRALAPYAVIAGVSLAILALVIEPGGEGAGGGVGYVARERLFQRWFPVNQLFSPDHGLVSNSPVILFALLGLPLLYRKDRQLALAFTITIAAQIVIGASSPGWNAGASFGARRFVECALPFAFGLATFIDLARRRPLLPIGVLLGGLATVNLALVDDARVGTLTLSESVTFDRMMQAVSSRIGNPFALPGAVIFAWQHDVPLSHLDRAPTRAFRDFTLNMGSEDDSAFLLGGWLARERDARGNFRWATEGAAGVFVRLWKGPYKLRVVAEPFVWRGAPAQTVEVRIGDRALGTFDLPPGVSNLELDVPDALTPPREYVRLSFRFAYARSPREVGISEDPRKLAARFESIALLRR